MLSEPTADNSGCWAMVSNVNGVTVFVWMGFDSAEPPGAESSSLRSLIQRSSLMLARELHREARNRLIARSEKKK